MKKNPNIIYSNVKKESFHRSLRTLLYNQVHFMILYPGEPLLAAIT